MSSFDEYDEEDVVQTGGPTTNIRLYLRASNLPKSITNQQPDTIARVSLISPQSNHLPPPVPPPAEDGELSEDGVEGGVLDETEVCCDVGVFWYLEYSSSQTDTCTSLHRLYKEVPTQDGQQPSLQIMNTDPNCCFLLMCLQFAL